MILNIIASWIISPLFGGLVGYLYYYYISKYILNAETYEKSFWKYSINSGITISFLTSTILTSNRDKLGISRNTCYMSLLIIGIITALVVHLFVNPYFRRRDKIVLENEDVEVNGDGSSNILKQIEEKYKYLMVISAVFVAFAHGSNDVANAVGPLSAIVEFAHSGTVTANSNIPVYIIFCGGIGIDIGLALLGYKVMETIGEKITKLTFTRGYAAQFGAALTVMLATALSLPISTTSVLVGSVAGTGMVKDKDGSGGVDRSILYKIVGGWVLTIIVGFSVSLVLYVILKEILV
eukprot:TRINITY_DN4941_c0_g1_i3.p1 TRINITY_DN4941_c0_g1~~TRINITY_DN4941_c0_g1_i3.p1  ORF type:complete len:294 (+),score=69.12 TRINITY_DN4941_c0_g1_i3:470-1351(+)